MSALLSLFLTLPRSRTALQLEVLWPLRHQLHVPRRLRLAKPDRWLWVVLSRVLTGWWWQPHSASRQVRDRMLMRY
jgi:hypothetical protein